MRGVAGLAGVFVVGLLVDRYGWQIMVALMAIQTVALAGQYAMGGSQVAAVITISVSGFTLAALSAALGARVLAVAPGGSDMAGAGTSTAFNVGITAGAFFGSVLLPGAGVRSTALAGALLTLVGFVVVLTEPAFSSQRHSHPQPTHPRQKTPTSQHPLQPSPRP